MLTIKYLIAIFTIFLFGQYIIDKIFEERRAKMEVNFRAQMQAEETKRKEIREEIFRDAIKGFER